MPSDDQPQIYLISPHEFELSVFSEQLKGILATTEIACFRLAMPGADLDSLARTADSLREICHAADVAIVIENHAKLAMAHGLDGVHLNDGPRRVRDLRKDLGADAIVGAFCGASRHNGLSAGEAGADYVSFGPITPDPLADGAPAETDLFAWWSEVVEVPVVAEGGLTPDQIKTLAPLTDFFAIGREIWRAEDPGSELKSLISNI